MTHRTPQQSPAYRAVGSGKGRDAPRGAISTRVARSEAAAAARRRTSPVVRSSIGREVSPGGTTASAGCPSRSALQIFQIFVGGYRAAAVGDPAAGIAPFDGFVEDVGGGELLEPAAFG